MGKSVCKGCGIRFPTEDMTVVSGLKYCPECAKPRLKEARTNIELNDYLFNLCNKDQDVMPYLTTQVKLMVDNNNFKPSGILATLKYVYDDSETAPPFNPRSGIQYIVQKYYSTARDFYIQVHHLNQTSEDEIKRILTMPTETITLTRSELDARDKRSSEKRKDELYGKEIDLNDIPDDD